MSLFLISCDGDKTKVSKDVAYMSALIKTILADDSYDESLEIPLPNVNKETLNRVIEFCLHHVNNPMAEVKKPLTSSDMIDIVSKWDAEYVNVELSILYSTMSAASYLDIPSLLDLCCIKIASMIRGKSPAEIKSIFNIVDDFTQKEEILIREENKWCES